ncbi:MAG: hypothetical protein HOM12_10955 [Proteobacteria bacterium]|jgi:suppressor for copper-sensitivity B|nr:hypothetical protein [Pseudomonadota bacterium]
MSLRTRKAGLTIGILIALLGCNQDSWADVAASDWVVSDYDRIRLISSGTNAGNQAALGIQIKLQPGWKTYWRAPGESGIPPRFDWTKSQNLESIEVLWPAPQRYASYGLETIGYKAEVVFPLVAKTRVADQDLAIDVEIDYAVCKDICIPLQARLSLNLPQDTATDTRYAETLRRYGERVPRAGGTNSASGTPTLVNFVPIESDGQVYVHATIGGITNPSEIDLFVEAGDDFGFGPPELVGRAPGDVVELRVPVHKYRKRANLRAQPLRLTLVEGPYSFEWQSPVAVD